MDLAALRDLVGSLLDYDPTNTTYENQLTSLLNDAQARVLTDRQWAFCEREGLAAVQTDKTYTINLVNGSTGFTTAAVPWSADTVLPGSDLDGAEVSVDETTKTSEYKVAYISSATQGYLTTTYKGVTGAYSATFKQREIYLPGDTSTLLNVQDASVGVPRNQAFLSKFERDSIQIDPDLLGTPSSFIPSEGIRIPAPRDSNGVAVVAASTQGIRTINVYMVNVWGPLTPTPQVYPQGVSAGRESGLSRVASYTLLDNQTLEFTPETIPNTSGFYRRYYFDCVELGIKAPVRVRNANDEGGGAAINVDTVSPAGGVVLKPDLSTTYLKSQSFQVDSIRYVPSNGVYQSFQLYPHPSSDRDMLVRRLISPTPMKEDQDVPLVPESYAQIIAYAALEQVALKHDSPALSEVYRRKKVLLYQGMEQRFLGAPARRIVKAGGGANYAAAWYGPLKLLP